MEAKTFNESFNYFKKNFSMNLVFLTEPFIEKRFKISIYLFIPGLILIIISSGMLIFFKNAVWFFLGIISLIPGLVYRFIISIHQIKKELKSKGYILQSKLNKGWFSWKTEELYDVRIRKIYEATKTIDSEIISKNITIAEQLAKEPTKNPFIFFEKLFVFIGKTSFAIISGILLFELKQDFSISNMYSTLFTISNLMFTLGLFAYIWEYLYKQQYFQESNSTKKQLKDYIYVMQNTLLLREYE